MEEDEAMEQTTGTHGESARDKGLMFGNLPVVVPVTELRDGLRGKEVKGVKGDWWWG